MKMTEIQILKDIMVIENMRYTKSGHYSATELIDPPRLIAMRRKYAEQLHRGIETQVDSLMGTAMHGLFEVNLKAFNELCDKPRYRLEEQVSADYMIDVDNGYRTVSGRFDILVDNTDIVDVKTAKCWKKIFDPNLTGWTQQQNIYAQLLTEMGETINSISALTIYKDWSAANALRDRKYPQEPIEMNELPLWDADTRTEFILDRLQQHVACETMDDTELPICTPDERWERFPDQTNIQFALFKTKKAKRASNILHGAPNLIEAVDMVRGIKGVTKDSYIEIRHPQRKRCEMYCAVCDFCDEHQRYMAKKKNDQLNEIYPLEGVI